MKRFAVALLVASFIGVTTVACDNTAEPNAVSVHVCDPWCVHAYKPNPSGKWF